MISEGQTYKPNAYNYNPVLIHPECKVLVRHINRGDNFAEVEYFQWDRFGRLTIDEMMSATLTRIGGKDLLQFNRGKGKHKVSFDVYE